jgi:hypothetical protein
MLFTRSAVALTASCMFGVFPGTCASAADLTIASTPPGSQKGAKREPSKAAKGQIAAKNRKRPEKDQRKKISVYNLLGNPAFKHGTGVSGKTRFGTASGMGLGTGIDYMQSRSVAPVQPNGVSNMPLGTGYRVDVPNNVNTPNAGSDCREKFANAGPNRREMTACFVHKLDRSWKAQTYVSRRSADGNTAWGGGLAVGYDY